MTPLMPCPRCTQALPVTARFCRRCGMAARPPTPAAPAASGRRPTGRLALAFGASSLTLVVATGLFVHRVPTPVAVPVTTVPAPGAVQTTPAAPRAVYPLPTPSRYLPSLTAPPGYRADPTRRDGHDHGRR